LGIPDTKKNGTGPFFLLFRRLGGCCGWSGGTGVLDGVLEALASFELWHRDGWDLDLLVCGEKHMLDSFWFCGKFRKK
jgi:hypothetical protein